MPERTQKHDDADDSKADELKVPADLADDLEPDDEASENVKAGAFKQGFPIKWQGAP